MKLTRKEREKLRKNQEIIEASIKVFSEKGFYEATMHDIANAVEMGVGTLYQYFKSKDDLYYNAILYKLSEFNGFYEEKLRNKQGYLEILSAMITAWIEYFGVNNDFFAIVFTEWINVKKVFARKLKKHLTNDFTEKYNEITKLLEQAQHDGEIKDTVNSGIVSSMIFGVVQQIIHRGVITKETFPSAFVAENVLSILSSGILKAK